MKENTYAKHQAEHAEEIARIKAAAERAIAERFFAERGLTPGGPSNDVDGRAVEDPARRTA